MNTLLPSRKKRYKVIIPPEPDDRQPECCGPIKSNNFHHQFNPRYKRGFDDIIRSAKVIKYDVMGSQNLKNRRVGSFLLDRMEQIDCLIQGYQFRRTEIALREVSEFMEGEEYLLPKPAKAHLTYLRRCVPESRPFASRPYEPEMLGYICNYASDVFKRLNLIYRQLWEKQRYRVMDILTGLIDEVERSASLLADNLREVYHCMEKEKDNYSRTETTEAIKACRNNLMYLFQLLIWCEPYDAQISRAGKTYWNHCLLNPYSLNPGCY